MLVPVILLLWGSGAHRAAKAAAACCRLEQGVLRCACEVGMGNDLGALRVESSRRGRSYSGRSISSSPGASDNNAGADQLAAVEAPQTRTLMPIRLAARVSSEYQQLTGVQIKNREIEELDGL